MIPVEKLLALLPPPLLDRLAVQYTVNAVNQIRLTGQTVFVCLLNALANHPLLTQRLLEETYQQLHGQHADHSSFGKRLERIDPEYFAALYRHVYREIQPRMTAGDQRTLRLRRVDATTVVLSAKLLAFGIQVGSGGRAGPHHAKRHVKAVFALSEAGLPEFLRLCRQQAEASDNPALGEPMIAATQPGDLWVVDAGLFDRDRLLRIHQAGGFFLVPQHSQKLRVRATVWEAPTPCSATPPVGKGGGKCHTPACRLLRVEQAVFENSNDSVVPARRQKWGQMPLLVLSCERWDVRSQRWQPWVLLTNLPLAAAGDSEAPRAGPFTFHELTELYRCRWDIETFFKFLKQQLSYAHLTSRSENGITVMIWMALITALLQIWYKGVTQIDRGWRSVKFWFAEDVRAWTQQRLRKEWEATLAAAGG
jgi:hypothetical protein